MERRERRDNNERSLRSKSTRQSTSEREERQEQREKKLYPILKRPTTSGREKKNLPFVDIEIEKDHFCIRFSEHNLKNLGYVKNIFDKFQKDQHAERDPMTTTLGLTHIRPRSLEVSLTQEDIMKNKVTSVGLRLVLAVLELINKYPKRREYLENLEKACNLIGVEREKEKEKEKLAKTPKGSGLTTTTTTTTKTRTENEKNEIALRKAIGKWLDEGDITLTAPTLLRFYAASLFLQFNLVVNILQFYIKDSR